VPEAASSLTAWSNFYVMTGSSAAALTGLMFVVITIVTGEDRLRRSQDGISIFSTPTVWHFCAALLISAMLSAPWHTLAIPGVLLACGGLFALGYVSRLAYLTSRLRNYSADVEDWVWYVVLPFAAYGAVLAGGIGLFTATMNGLFALAAAVVLLMFIGIHNAWDVVTFIATGRAAALPSSDGEGPSSDDSANAQTSERGMSGSK